MANGGGGGGVPEWLVWLVGVLGAAVTAALGWLLKLLGRRDAAAKGAARQTKVTQDWILMHQQEMILDLRREKAYQESEHTAEKKALEELLAAERNARLKAEIERAALIERANHLERILAGSGSGEGKTVSGGGGQGT